MRAHWFRGRGFGDHLTETLLPLLGVPVEWAPAGQARLLGCGSIISHLPDTGWSGIVLGSGLIRAGLTRDLRRAEVLCVRGPLTRDACHLPDSTAFGDLGLLSDMLLDGPKGGGGPAVVPHYVDREMTLRHPGLPVVDVCGTPAQVVNRMAGHDLIFTSSLHGLICADVLGIPHVWEPCAGVIGGGFKFRDYAMSLGGDVRPGLRHLSDRHRLFDAQQTVRQAVQSLLP